MTALFSREKGKGKLILLVHGFPFHQEIWDGYVERLSDEFRVITIDLPGFGKSEPLKSSFTLDQVATTLLDFLRKNDLKK